MQTIAYPYSKVSGIFFSALLLAIISMSIPHLIKFINNHELTNWVFILIFDFVITLILLYIVIKQLIPALKNQIALELNETGLVSYAKNVIIEWKDIKDVRLIMGKSSSALELNFKWKTDHGNYIRIPLGFVKGNDSKIYDTILSYLQNHQ